MNDGKSKIEIIYEAIDKFTKVAERIEKAQLKGSKAQTQSAKAEAKAAIDAERLAQAKQKTAAATERATTAANRSKISEQQLAAATARAAAASDRAALAALNKAKADSKAAGEAKKNESANIALAGAFMRLASRVGSGAAAYLSFRSALVMTGDVLESIKIMDRIENGLRAITKSSELAGEEFKYVRAEAERLGLNLASTSQNYAKLLASGRSTGFQMEEMREIFEATNEAAVALSLSNEDVEGTLRAMFQMMSKGSVQAEELKGQLGERLYGAFGLAANALGVNTRELNKMLETGDVLAKDLLPLLALELKKTFGDDAERAAKDYAREVNRLETAMFDLRVEIGKEIEPGVTEFVRDLRQALQDLIDSGIIQDVSGLISGLRDVAADSIKFWAKLANTVEPVGSGFDLRSDEEREQENRDRLRERLMKRMVAANPGKVFRDDDLQALDRQVDRWMELNAYYKNLTGEQKLALDEKAKAELDALGVTGDRLAVQERIFEILNEIVPVEEKRARRSEDELAAEQRALIEKRNQERLAESLRVSAEKHAEKMEQVRLKALGDGERLLALQEKSVALYARSADTSLPTAERGKAYDEALAVDREIYALKAELEADLQRDKVKASEALAKVEREHAEAMADMDLVGLGYAEKRAALEERLAAAATQREDAEGLERKLELRKQELELLREIRKLDQDEQRKEAEKRLQVIEQIKRVEEEHAKQLEKIQLGSLNVGERLLELERLRASAAALREAADPDSEQFLAALEQELGYVREIARVRAEMKKDQLPGEGMGMLEGLSEGFFPALEAWSDTYGTSLTQAHELWTDIFDSIENGTTRAFEGLFGSTDYWVDKLGVAGHVIGGMAEAASRFFAEWITKRLIVDQLETMLGRKKQAETIAQGATALAANTPGAVAAGISSFGAAALIGTAAVAAALAAFTGGLPGFATGVVDYRGQGGTRSDSNLIRFSNRESVITAKGTAMNKRDLEYANAGGRISDLYEKPQMLPEIWVVPTEDAAASLARQIPSEVRIRKIADEQIMRRRA